MKTDSKFSQLHSATFREFILLPRKTCPEHAIGTVDLMTSASEGFPLSIPFMSAAMESVTGYELAIALASHGGIGVLPAGRVSADEQVRQIEKVKAYRDGFLRTFYKVRSDCKLREVDRLELTYGYSSYPVLDEDGRLVGAISSGDYHPIEDLDLPVTERMVPLSDLTLFRTESPRTIEETMFSGQRGHAYLVDSENRLEALIVRSGLKRELRFREAIRDDSGRLKVAAAISTHPEDRERARRCVEAGADLICIDSSDGFSEYMAETVEQVKNMNVPVVAGNVVDRAGFDFLAQRGADAIKIGVGSGSICTTRRVKAIGRGQATAVRQVALARDEWAQRTGKYIPLISDGGLAGTGDMSVALALGADVLMMGKYFAGFDESPTQAYVKKFPVFSSGGSEEVTVSVKPYWGEASARAKNVRRYQQDDPRTFVIEGEEGYVLSKGSLHDHVPRDLKAIRGTLSSCGCSSLAEFRAEVRLERQSVGSQQEGGTSIFQG